MANIKSAKKRIRTSQKSAEANKAVRSSVKTSMKKVRSAVAAGDKSVAEEELRKATANIERAASKGVIHKNNASNKVSKLSAAVSKMD